MPGRGFSRINVMPAVSLVIVYRPTALITLGPFDAISQHSNDVLDIRSGCDFRGRSVLSGDHYSLTSRDRYVAGRANTQFDA
jgi:hypothetical protein